jgi:hypothetical protein
MEDRKSLPRLNQVLFPSQVLVDELSSRIQEAYALRRPDWRGTCSTARVWNAAAERLWAAHAADPARVPLDAELFVASQPISIPFADPWSELTQPESARRYRSTLRRIVRRLRGELKREVGRAERLLGRGRDIRALLEAGGRISPLGCFMVALRAGRAELADRFAAAATAQHRACPLLREASDALLSTDLYPVETHFAPHAVESDLKPRVEKLLLSLN